ncbi:MAG TPA: endonuclease/exonuclease/phosphatase family protein [Flavobacterium sp.]|jgi:endonuclease/exonuclease/phosphatase family metal-dependent hydrolase
MKKLSWFNKTMFFFNIVLAVLTFIAYVLPFLAPKVFPILSVLTFILPLFLILNSLFFIYWAIQLKKQVFLSGVLLLIGITFINKFYKFSSVNLPEHEKDFTVMSYNARLFNLFKWLPNENVPREIQTFINDQNPDILCIQEYSSAANIDLKAYPHKFILMRGDKIKTGHGIFSKFKIIDEGNLEFPDSDNNVVYADIKKGLDTIRVYSMHLQSIKITPDVDGISQDINGLDQRRSTQIFRRMSIAFREQQLQAEIIMKHKEKSPYPIIICGDMNNSAFSYVYRSIRGKLNDTFEEGGNGFGQTYHFKYYPARIDYIFADKQMRVKEFRNFPEFVNSDHYPIMTRLFIE